MGQAERRANEFPRLVAAEAAPSGQVANLFAPASPIVEAALPGVDPQARRVAVILFMGAVVGFWASVSAAVSTYFF